MQITTTTTTTTTTPAPSTEAGNDTDTTLAPEARRKRSIYSEEELQAMLARSKRAVPSDVLTEGVNKFIPREMMLGWHTVTMLRFIDDKVFGKGTISLKSLHFPQIHFNRCPDNQFQPPVQESNR